MKYAKLNELRDGTIKLKKEQKKGRTVIKTSSITEQRHQGTYKTMPHSSGIHASGRRLLSMYPCWARRGTTHRNRATSIVHDPIARNMLGQAALLNKAEVCCLGGRAEL